MGSLFSSSIFLFIRTAPPRLFLFSVALGMSISANAQPAFADQATSIASGPQSHSQHQEAMSLDRTSVSQSPLVDEVPNAPEVALQATLAWSQQNSKPATGSASATPLDLKGQAANGQTNQVEGTALITGVVSDAQGNGVSGAEITLTSPGKLGHERKTAAASDGTFTFTGLPAGKYRLVVTADGLGTYTSSELLVQSGESVRAPKIALNVTTASSVNVYASADQVAEAQVEEQEKQRVFGVFQNFYTSYIWEADPMSAKQKYKLVFHTILDPTTFLVLAGVAGAEHYNGTYPGYGPGIEGYGKRYGAALADSVSGRIIGSAILPSLFHQDPRYFYQGSGGVGSRTWHALTSALVTRGDNGKLQPNYSHLLGNLAAGGIANAYHPESSRGLGLTFQTLGITTGANAIGNLFREFVLRSLEPSVPGFANGKKVSTSKSGHP